MLLAFVVTLLAGLSTVIGGWLGTRTQVLRRDVLAAALAFAAGIMIAISVVEIAPSALASVGEVVGEVEALFWVGGAALLGAMLVVLIDKGIPRDVNPAEIGGGDQLDRIQAGQIDARLLRSGILLAAVVALHNLPEGLATFVSTLKEPYRVEGKKTMGLELVEQLGWRVPDAIIYPTGGGTGLIGMWKAFAELRQAGWLEGALPRMYSVQATGCAPIVRAFEAGVDTATPWPDPMTVASGLRVPGALGDKLILRALAESGGGAMAVDDEQLSADASLMTAREGIDCGPEGGATLSALRELRAIGRISADERVVIFNTGSGWLYRSPTLQGEEAGGILTP